MRASRRLHGGQSLEPAGSDAGEMIGGPRLPVRCAARAPRHGGARSSGTSWRTSSTSAACVCSRADGPSRAPRKRGIVLGGAHGRGRPCAAGSQDRARGGARMVGRRPRVALRVLGQRRRPTDRVHGGGQARGRRSEAVGRRRTTRWPRSRRRCPGTRSSLVPRRRGKGSGRSCRRCRDWARRRIRVLGRDVRSRRRAHGRDRAVRCEQAGPEGGIQALP